MFHSSSDTIVVEVPYSDGISIRRDGGSKIQKLRARYVSRFFARWLPLPVPMERAQLRFECVDRMLNVPAIASPFERLKFLQHLITEIKRFERWCIARIKSMLSNEHFEIVCNACHSYPVITIIRRSLCYICARSIQFVFPWPPFWKERHRTVLSSYSLRSLPNTQHRFSSWM